VKKSMRVFSIKTVLLSKSWLFVLAFLIGEVSANDQLETSKKKLKCNRGLLKVVTVGGVERYACVVGKKEKESLPELSPLNWQARWWGRFGLRPKGTPLIASNRYRAEGELDKGVAPWTKAVLGARITHDLMSNIQGDEFRDNYSRNGKPEFELWNAYLDFSRTNWRVRLGQQQVAWGEAFGFFYADIVNPKDLRERNLGKLADLRLPIPMASVQWSARSLNIQGIYVPFFRPDRMPTQPSDFFPESSSNFGLPPGIVLDTLQKHRIDDSQGDFGGRVSGTLGGVDMSVIYFNYIDRQAHYRPVSNFPIGNRFLLESHHNRVQSSGLTFSTELSGGVIVRSENVYTPKRKYNVMSMSGFSEDDYSQRVHVLGVDLPKWDKVQFSFQGSLDQLGGESDTLLRDKNVTIGSLMFRWDLPHDQEFFAIASVETKEMSSLIQSRYLYPISRHHEFETGVDLFSGKEDSFFGQVENASRIYIGLRGAFNG
jgi:hypothetical protein